MNDPAWINAALVSARPQAIAALLRYFRDMDTAEEAYQEACLRALNNWTQNGPPRDPAAWLILVGRNAALDATRRRRKQVPLPADDALSDVEDVESTAPTIAMTCCGCCSSAVIPIFRQPSKSRSRCASFPGSPSSKSRARSW
jgi:predicted RNA polymerase sigma factor